MFNGDAINADALLPGDLVFFINHYYKPGATDKTPVEERYDTSWEPYVDHVAMYAGRGKDDCHQLVHSIAPTEESKDDLSKPSGLCCTTFRPLLNQQDEDDPNIHYDVVFKAFRFVDSAIATDALRYMEKWKEFRIPYDEKRLEIKLQKEADMSTEDFLAKATKSYQQRIGLYRAIKFAARRNTSLTRPRQEDNGHGLTCSMIVTLAFQVAELAPFVNVVAKQFWVSDKHGEKPLRLEEEPRYQQYLESIGNREECSTQIMVGKARCSRFFWIQDLNEFQHRSFRFDCKIIGAAGIYAYIDSNPNEWTILGEVQVASPQFSEACKREYKIGILSSAFSAALASSSSARLLEPRCVTPPKALPILQQSDSPERLKKENTRRPQTRWSISNVSQHGRESSNEDLTRSTEHRSPSKPLSQKLTRPLECTLALHPTLFRSASNTKHSGATKTFPLG